MTQNWKFGTGHISVQVRPKEFAILIEPVVNPLPVGQGFTADDKVVVIDEEKPSLLFEFTDPKSIDVLIDALADVRAMLVREQVLDKCIERLDAVEATNGV